MTYKHLLSILIALATMVWVFTACEKDDDPDTNDDNSDDTEQVSNEDALAAIGDYAKAQNMFSEATDEAEHAARVSDDSINNRAGSAITAKEGGYPQITIDPFDATTWPKTISVDFGEQNIVCEDGRERRGVINIEATDFYHNEGAELTTTFDNFYQNDHKVEGTRVCTNNGENGAGNLTYSLVINDGHITTPEGEHIYYEENTEREWVAGDTTLLNPWDDNYMVTGTQSGLSTDSIPYDLNVHSADPLDVLVGCQWIRAGKLDLNIESIPTITINYGDGTCDDQAVATMYGQDYPFTMQ
jgi:hypothetical protein